MSIQPTPIYDRAAWDHGFAPMPPQTTLPAACFRCTGAPISWQPGHATDGLCLACRGEVSANRDDARDELIATIYTGHGINHTYRQDVTR